MSKQFQIFLLPADAESLIHNLRSKLEFTLVQSSSPKPFPLQAGSPLCTKPEMLKKSARVDCYLIPSLEADIKMRFVPLLSHWKVEIESEAIEISGCEFDGSVLLGGRFYFKNDILLNGMIVPKRKEFLIWADKVFRSAKKSLARSKTLDAYVGEEAARWRQSGGRFAWLATPDRGLIYTKDDASTQDTK